MIINNSYNIAVQGSSPYSIEEQRHYYQTLAKSSQSIQKLQTLSSTKIKAISTKLTCSQEKIKQYNNTSGEELLNTRSNSFQRSKSCLKENKTNGMAGTNLNFQHFMKNLKIQNSLQGGRNQRTLLTKQPIYSLNTYGLDNTNPNYSFQQKESQQLYSKTLLKQATIRNITVRGKDVGFIRGASVGRIRPAQFDDKLRNTLSLGIRNIESEDFQPECFIKDLPEVYSASDGMVQPTHLVAFIDFIKAVKDNFPLERVNRLRAEKLRFDGLYSNGTAKFNGLQIFSDGNLYIGAFHENQRKGFGIQLYLANDTSYQNVYRGEWLNDRPHGKGMLYNHQEKVIIGGLFKDGQIDKSLGEFRMRYPNGDIYEGSMLYLKRHGIGKLYSFESGDFYHGNWKHDKREGKGRLTIKGEELEIEGLFSNDEIIEGKMKDRVGNIFTTLADAKDPGQFQNGKLQGKIQVAYANGDSFIGHYKDGKKNGKGTQTYASLKSSGLPLSSKKDDQAKDEETGVYEGNWKRDLREGFGIMTWSDSSKFTGQWRQDQRFSGQMMMTDGTIYEGQFQNDKYHGRGKIKIRVGGKSIHGELNYKVFEGMFMNGEIPKEGKIYFTSKDDNSSKGVYFGEHHDFEKHGYGLLFQELANQDINKAGIKYEGFFKEDLKERMGIELQQNGDYYYGQWESGRQQGYGRQYISSSRSIYEGQWDKGLKHGDGTLIEQKNGAATITEGEWRQGKLDGKTAINDIQGKAYLKRISELQMDQIGGVLGRLKGIRSLVDAFKVPDHFKCLI